MRKSDPATSRRTQDSWRSNARAHQQTLRRGPLKGLIILALFCQIETASRNLPHPGPRASRRPPELERQQLVELRRTAIRLRHGGLNPLRRVQVLSRRPPRYLLHDQTPRSADALKAPVGRQRACCSLTRWLPARRGPRRPPRRSAARQSGEATPVHSSVRVR